MKMNFGFRPRISFGVLARNIAAGPTTKPAGFSALICNLLPANSRIETLEDREHIVLPMVILTEGVHCGSSGALLYSTEELAKTPEAWNHKPIVVYHPEMNGAGISACAPDIINTRKIGVMMNTKFEDGKLKSEAWIERNRADLVDTRIMKAVDAGTMMELSTGVFIDVEETSGTWNNEEYVGIARNFRADHLALLPDQIGACSIADGAGFIRNRQKGGLVRNMLNSIGLGKLIKNEDFSHSVIGDRLQAALQARFSADGNDSYCWVQDVFDSFVVYSLNGRFWRLGYTATDTGVTLDTGKPTEVFRVVSYRTVTAPTNNTSGQPGTTNNTEPMDKKKLVDGIIAANKGWPEAKRTTLMAMDDSDLTLIHNMVTAPAPAAPAGTTTNIVPAAVIAPVTAAAVPAPVVPAAPKTVDEYIAAAPEGMQSVLRNSLALHAQQKSALIEKIVANTNNPFPKESLEKKELSELQALAKLAGIAAEPALAANYVGQGNTASATTNSEEALGLPTTLAAK